MIATHLLATHHSQLRVLLDSLVLDRSARIARVTELVDNLTAHLAVEQHFFYDRIRDASGESLEPCERRHATIKSALRHVVKSGGDDDAFAREIDFLRTLVEKHIAEEQALAPIAERVVPPCELDALGVRMQDFFASTVAERARTR